MKKDLTQRRQGAKVGEDGPLECEALCGLAPLRENPFQSPKWCVFGLKLSKMAKMSKVADKAE